jgi:glycosyltransferase involved in cell wall biosynthesis
MKVSIVTAHFDSHEIARRQILHYNMMNLDDDVEVIFVDDGSEPPLCLADIEKNFKFYLYHTHDKRPWTQPAARNYGVKMAEGDYVICADLDHIIMPDVISVAKNAKAHVIRFKRYAGVLLDDGTFTQDYDELRRWGLCERYFKPGRNLKLPPHGNSYIFKRQLYDDIGGVDERYVGTGKYPNREEVPLKRKLKRLVEKNAIDIIDDDTKPIIYMIPNGKYCGNGTDRDYNPFGFFHTLSRERNIGRLTNKQKRKMRAAAREKRSISNNTSPK